MRVPWGGSREARLWLISGAWGYRRRSPGLAPDGRCCPPPADPWPCAPRRARRRCGAARRDTSVLRGKCRHLRPAEREVAAWLEPKARPERSRFDSRNEVGCKPWRDAEVGSDVAYGDAAPAAEPARRRRDQAEADLVSVELAHLAAEVGQTVYQSKLERPPSGPELTGEEAVSCLLDADATPRLDEIDELSMHVALDGLDALDGLLLHRDDVAERRLVAAGGIDAPLDADLVDQLVQTERGGDDADRADDRACIGIDLVAGDREQVASRRGDVLGKHVDLQILLLRECSDALVDQIGEHTSELQSLRHLVC